MSTSPKPIVTLIVVARNAQSVIRPAVDSILLQDVGREAIEVVLVDSASTDGTRRVMEELQARSPGIIRVIDNPGVHLSRGWNRAIRSGQGEYFLRVDAHSELQPDYVRLGLETIRERTEQGINPGRLVVGGVLQTVGAGFWGRCNAQLMSHPFGTGNSRFRTQSEYEGFADTVPYGMYPRCVFEEFGLFDETLGRGEDLELHARLRAGGVRFYQQPSMKATYGARGSPGGLLAKSYGDGLWSARASRIRPDVLRARHMAPLGLAVSIVLLVPLGLAPLRWIGLAGVSLYLVLSVLAGLHISWFSRRPLYALVLPPLFWGFHLSRALGLIQGLLAGRPRPLQQTDGGAAS